jgi:hypothetical protein
MESAGTEEVADAHAALDAHPSGTEEATAAVSFSHP